MNNFEINKLLARTMFGVEAVLSREDGQWYLIDRDGKKVGPAHSDGLSCWNEQEVPDYFNDGNQTIALLLKIAEARVAIPEFIYLKEQHIWIYPNIDPTQQERYLTADSFKAAVVGFVKAMYKL